VDRVPVSSEALTSVGYEPDTSRLEIEFSSGGVYRYYGVPATIHEELMAAESHGRYFAERIRDRFPYRKL
jgi:hypothetical protein